MNKKRAALLDGFTKIAKVYAVGPEKSSLTIYEDKNTSSRTIGTLPQNGLCFIIEPDSGDGWAYIESGDVRGFVKTPLLRTGTEAEDIVTKTGEAKMKTASAKISAFNNKAYRYSLKTVRNVEDAKNIASVSGSTREQIVNYALNFLGKPYVWGGESLDNGTDCSGFTMCIYANFGITLPHSSAAQASCGTAINPADAQPGDLLFYADNGQIYHVLMYIGGGQAINASSSTTGVIISNVDYSKVTKAVSLVTDETEANSSIYSTTTQASDLQETGKKAAAGDEDARKEIIDALLTSSSKEWVDYGYCRSVLIAQVIEDTNWLSFSDEGKGGIAAADNNVLNMTSDLDNDSWSSPWTGQTAARYVTELNSKGQAVFENEQARTYFDIENCMEDYAAYRIAKDDSLVGVTDVDEIVAKGFDGFETSSTYTDDLKKLIKTYDLTQYDSVSVAGTQGETLVNSEITSGNADSSSYTQDQLELIWAIVGQEDSGSYEGALAVITSAMNRADQNYGGYGKNALAQLTAPGQYCYSPSVSDPSYYQARLGGNVADYVKQAVSDCLTKGYRNHSYLNFRSRNSTGHSILIGENWYY